MPCGLEDQLWPRIFVCIRCRRTPSTLRSRSLPPELAWATYCPWSPWRIGTIIFGSRISLRTRLPSPPTCTRFCAPSAVIVPPHEKTPDVSRLGKLIHPAYVYYRLHFTVRVPEILSAGPP